VFEYATADPYAVEFERFAAAVLDGGPTPVPAEDAVANLRVIERIFAAAELEPGTATLTQA
jgi:predicted dehydrogenase